MSSTDTLSDVYDSASRASPEKELLTPVAPVDSTGVDRTTTATYSTMPFADLSNVFDDPDYHTDAHVRPPRSTEQCTAPTCDVPTERTLRTLYASGTIVNELQT